MCAKRNRMPAIARYGSLAGVADVGGEMRASVLGINREPSKCVELRRVIVRTMAMDNSTWRSSCTDQVA